MHLRYPPSVFTMGHQLELMDLSMEAFTRKPMGKWDPLVKSPTVPCWGPIPICPCSVYIDFLTSLDDPEKKAAITSAKNW